MKLILIDPHVTIKSPSMRAWVGAFPLVRDLFSEVEIWATECDIPNDAVVTWRQVPQRLPSWTLHAMDFQYRTNRMSNALQCTNQRLVQVTGCMVTNPDIRYIHYWNNALLEEQALRKQNFPLPLLKKIPAMLSAKKEKIAIRSSKSKDAWWVVSRSLGDHIQASGAAGVFDTLPNQYDPDRFHSKVRDEWREPMRTQYGFMSNEKVLTFSAFGHFERKGLRQAVEAVEMLCVTGHKVRLLILGGTITTIARFQKTLRRSQQDVCIFAGLVDHIERHLVAADGFLFPSHFEAFSLAEIEAAALGLRLYLTPHYGSEMILREPINGRILPWDSAGMADVIAKDIQNGQLDSIHHEMGEAISKKQYGDRLRSLYQEAIDRKNLSL